MKYSQVLDACISARRQEQESSERTLIIQSNGLSGFYASRRAAAMALMWLTFTIHYFFKHALKNECLTLKCFLEIRMKCYELLIDLMFVSRMNSKVWLKYWSIKQRALDCITMKRKWKTKKNGNYSYKRRQKKYIYNEKKKMFYLKCLNPAFIQEMCWLKLFRVLKIK